MRACELGHFLYEVDPWIPKEIESGFVRREPHGPSRRAEPPWNPPAAKVPIVQAEEQQTAVTFERSLQVPDVTVQQ